jgi:two-component system sensor histidine kinase YesM
MFLLITFVLLAFSVGGISILQYAFHVYNKEIYRQSAQSLRVSSTSIETELRKMERLSYQVATDQHLQSYLLDLKYITNEFDQFLIGTKLRKRLVQIGALSKYVNSLQVYDVHGTEHKVGNQSLILHKDRLNEIKDKIQSKEGGAEWIYPDSDDPSLIVARDARYYITFSLEQIGQIVVRFDIGQIVSDIIGNIDEEGTNFLMFNEHDELVYSVNNSLSESYIINHIGDEKGYNIIEIDGEQYFATYSPSNDSNWTYVFLSPYSSLFQAISSVRTAVVITYTIMFIFVMFMGMRFITNITRPIESLNQKMKRVQTGVIDFFDDGSEFQFSKDESGEMHDNFTVMMEQINTLIEENYKKQIVIKDAEYKTLQAQINPHFLYNTLDSINWAAKMSGQKKVSEMAESLGCLLRFSINMKESLITVEEELKVVNSYITIQSYRFEERLVFNMDMSERIMQCKVPKFVLQPLIENSIQYGLQQMIGICEITVQGKVVEDQVILTVVDNGPGMDEQYLKQLQLDTYESKGTGLGLKNIRERIKLLFGEPYGIHVESEKGKGTKVTITIPYGGENNV